MLTGNKAKLISLATFTILIFLMATGYFSGFFFYSEITPCSPPPNILVDGAAEARVYAWIDANSNGSVDVGESPLAHVEILYPLSDSNDNFTDDSSSADTYDFKAGCACKCWQGSVVVVAVPNGYSATTPTRVELTGDDSLIKFGFIKVSP